MFTWLLFPTLMALSLTFGPGPIVTGALSGHFTDPPCPVIGSIHGTTVAVVAACESQQAVFFLLPHPPYTMAYAFTLRIDPATLDGVWSGATENGVLALQRQP